MHDRLLVCILLSASLHVALLASSSLLRVGPSQPFSDPKPIRMRLVEPSKDNGTSKPAPKSQASPTKQKTSGKPVRRVAKPKTPTPQRWPDRKTAPQTKAQETPKRACPGCPCPQRASLEEAFPPDPGHASQDVLAQEPIKDRYLKVNLGAIGSKIEGHLSYPYIARRMGYEGRVLLSFSIGPDGQVKKIRLVKSSGYRALDREAKRAVQAACPFPAPNVEISLTLPITFRLK